MAIRRPALILAAALAAALPLQGIDAIDLDPAGDAALPYLQCVPYARQVSGIRIYGDAHTWWQQAEGRYAKGSTPRVGAVMSFPAYGNMRLGHVAAVSRILDSRNVLLRHANWSPINGRRGQIEDDVRATDVSENNDWSRVRVWYAPIQALGGTQWPLNGFIYNEKPRRQRAVLAAIRPAPASLARPAAGKTMTAPANARRLNPPMDRDPIGEIIAGVAR